MLTVKVKEVMEIEPIDDSNSDFEKVQLRDPLDTGKLTPHCTDHGAMNKVSLFEDGGGYWRCIAMSSNEEDCRAGCIERREDTQKGDNQ